MAFEKVNGPLGGERSDTQTAILAATVVNSQRDKKQPRAKVSDFVPVWDKPPAQTWQEQLAIVKQINKAMGGTEEKR